jgi:hypothetical protein
MACRHKVELILSADALESFRAFSTLPNTTTDRARAWLMDRGFSVSRSAVGNYRRRFLRDGIVCLRPRLGVRDDPQARQLVVEAANRLSRDELTHLAVTAVCLLNIQATRLREIPAELSGTELIKKGEKGAASKAR